MIDQRQQRIWLWIAAIAIVVALVLLLVPQAHSGGPGAWLALLPVLFIGVAAPLRLLEFLDRFDPERRADAPAFEPSFQRPPPLEIA